MNLIQKLRRILKKNEKEGLPVPKSIQELWIMAAHNYFVKEMPHSAFLRNAPKNYRFVRDNNVFRKSH